MVKFEIKPGNLIWVRNIIISEDVQIKILEISENTVSYVIWETGLKTTLSLDIFFNTWHLIKHSSILTGVIKKPTVLILGKARSGKDTLAEWWANEFDMTFQSSSRACAEIFIFDALKTVGHYETVDECFEDRHNWRALWYNLITMYNTPDLTRLAKEILKTNQCYVGMRRGDEVEACRKDKLFDHYIWVDADFRLDKIESKSSQSIQYKDYMLRITNNNSLDDFYAAAQSLGQKIFKNG